MKKQLIIFSITAIICTSIPIYLLLNNYFEGKNKSEDTNNVLTSSSMNKSNNIHTKYPVEESHTNSYPTTLSKQLLPLMKPKDTQKYNGSNKGVQEYVSYLLKDPTSTVVPQNYKNKFFDTVPGEPFFIKDERDSSNDVLQDHYIVPLLKDNKTVGQCSVAIWGDELALATIGDWEDSGNSVFRRNLNEIFDKVRAKAGVELKSYQLVVKPDYKNRISMSFLDPQIKITTVDGQIFYYSSKGLILNKTEADENSLIKYKSLG